MTIVGLHPEELFDKMLDGELLPPERERLLAHLDSCEVCRFEYAARLDFQEEALALSASTAPPVLPLRPLLGIETPLPLPAPRRRRSRALVWGLSAAALIVASGAVAAGLSGKAPWRSVSLLFAPQAVPVEHASVVPKSQLGRAAADHQVAPPGQRPKARRERLPGLAAHHDRLAQRQRLEARQVLRDVPQQGVVPADGTIARHGRHQRDAAHTATGALMAGCGS